MWVEFLNSHFHVPSNSMKYEAWPMNVSWPELKTPSLTLNNRSICLPNRPSNLTLASYFLTGGSDLTPAILRKADAPPDPITTAWLTLCLLDQFNKECETGGSLLVENFTDFGCGRDPLGLRAVGQTHPTADAHSRSALCTRVGGWSWQGQSAGFWQTM